jgi:hypothetical protein
MFKLFFLYILFCISFSQEPVNQNYWFQGKAEITSYQLDQVRYGEIHKGNAVLIFVTEDFSQSKQVKLDYPAKVPEDAVKVLKLNSSKKFLTGIYPYSMMNSVFTPITQERYSPSLKITTSSQEWCGHTFTQFNYDHSEKTYKYQQFSYFESEGDIESNVKADLIEDEIWTLIRLNPDGIKTGTLMILPSGFFLRLSHQKIKAYSADLELKTIGDQKELSIVYPDLKRILKITFNARFPYEIESWEEEVVAMFSEKIMTTKAVRKKRKLVDYWTKNKNKDRKLVLDLDLPLNH